MKSLRQTITESFQHENIHENYSDEFAFDIEYDGPGEKSQIEKTLKKARIGYKWSNHDSTIQFKSPADVQNAIDAIMDDDKVQNVGIDEATTARSMQTFDSDTKSVLKALKSNGIDAKLVQQNREEFIAVDWKQVNKANDVLKKINAYDPEHIS